MNICKCVCVDMFVDIEIVYFHQNVCDAYSMSWWNIYIVVKWIVCQKSGLTLPTFRNNCIVMPNYTNLKIIFEKSGKNGQKVCHSVRKIPRK